MRYLYRVILKNRAKLKIRFSILYINFKHTYVHMHKDDEFYKRYKLVIDVP